MFSTFIKRIRLYANSFRGNLILFYSLLLCGSLLATGIATSIRFSNTLYEESVSQVKSAAKQFENSMNLYFDDVSNYIKSFLADERLYTDVQNYSFLSGYEKHNAYTAIDAQIARVLNGNDNISDVFIYNDALQLHCVQDSQGVPAKFNSDFLQNIKQELLSSNHFSIHFLVVDRNKYTYSGGSEQRLLVCFPLRDYRYLNGAPLAVVIFEYKLDRLEKMFATFAYSDQCRSFLLDENDQVILGEQKENETLQKNDNTLYLVRENTPSALTRIDVTNTGWHLEYIIQSEIIRSRIRMQQHTLLLILLVTILLSIILSILLGHYLGYPFTRLLRVMERLASGDLSARLEQPERFYSEFRALGNGFNDMAEQLETLLSDMYEASLLQNKAELSAIRSKINPHFFYNALQTISSFAMLDDCDHVQQAVQLLGEQFEYVVYGEAEFVPLRQEIAHIQGYMEYQNLRQQHPIHLQIHVPPSLRNERIPKLILQPLIENCIKHAFSQTDTNGHICITAFRQTASLRITVTDNGCGISPEKLSTIQESLHITRPDNHIGLSSIHNRLHLRWSGEYGLLLTSVLGQGTTLTLTLPLLGKELENENTHPSC